MDILSTSLRPNGNTWLSFGFYLIFSALAWAIPPDTLKVGLDLTRVNSDRLQVNLSWNGPRKSTFSYQLPRMVPGTYAVYDFGRFVDSLFYWKNNQAFFLTPSEALHWEIPAEADSLYYWVHDSFDDTNWLKRVFEPAGTSFEADKVFLLNLHGLIGYVSGRENDLPYSIQLRLPSGFVAASGTEVHSKGNLVWLNHKNYHQVVDHPILAGPLDVVHLNVGNCKIEVAVYHEKKAVQAQEIAEVLQPLMHGIQSYLGGELPVQKYSFLFYLSHEFKPSAGALEHGTSSVYFLPVITKEYLMNMVKDIAAHEFFHILTPLNLHSEQIHYFDYENPKMSRHLWLYEGATEYSSALVQVRSGLMSPDDFLDWIQEKILGAAPYGDALSFTELSLNCLKETKAQYGNVYQKGALLAMALDLWIRKSYPGYGFPDLMKNLMKVYGPDRPFADSLLIQEITEMYPSPELKAFFNQHVEGNQPFGILQSSTSNPSSDLKAALALAGIEYQNRDSLSCIDPGFDVDKLVWDGRENKAYVASRSHLTALGKRKGLRMGDFIVSVGDLEIGTVKDIEKLYRELCLRKEIAPLRLNVERPKNKTLKPKQVDLPLQYLPQVSGLELHWSPSIQPEQHRIKSQWLNQP